MSDAKDNNRRYHPYYLTIYTETKKRQAKRQAEPGYQTDFDKNWQHHVLRKTTKPAKFVKQHSKEGEKAELTAVKLIAD